MPVHGWLPAAMVAPTPVSALLHAVAVVKTGVFTVLSVVFFVFGTDTLSALGVNKVAIAIACFTLLMASVIALSRENLKARLAFSTVSQLSYIILGAALLTLRQLSAAYRTSPCMRSARLRSFSAPGRFTPARTRRDHELSGLAKKMPWTMTAFTIGAFNMIGVPLVADL
jgi:multicomponent Na+:H+ antiporter subunit D